MSWQSALITAGAHLLGGALDRDNAQDQAANNTALQKEFAQNGIRWRVEDAKAAGLHPLYALGGSGAAYANQPIALSNWSDSFGKAGQALGAAVSQQQSGGERALRIAQLEHLRAQTSKEHAEAAYFASEAARVRQAPVAGPPPSVTMPPATNTGAIEVKPDEVTSTRRDDFATTAGIAPMWREYTMENRPGRAPVRIKLPAAQDIGEALEGLKLPIIPSWLGQNWREYGPRGMLEMVFGGGQVEPLPEVDLRNRPASEHDPYFHMDPYERAIRLRNGSTRAVRGKILRK